MAKIVVHLPDDLMLAVERLRQESKAGFTTSQFCRFALEELLRRDIAHKEEMERQREFFEREETEEEYIAWVHQASLLALAEMPWEDSPET